MFAPKDLVTSASVLKINSIIYLLSAYFTRYFTKTIYKRSFLSRFGYIIIALCNTVYLSQTKKQQNKESCATVTVGHGLKYRCGAISDRWNRSRYIARVYISPIVCFSISIGQRRWTTSVYVRVVTRVL